MQNVKWLMSSVAFLVGLASSAFAEEEQQNLRQLLPEVSLMASSNPLLLATADPDSSSCKENIIKGCSGPAPYPTPGKQALGIATPANAAKDRAVPFTVAAEDHRTKLEPGMVLDAPVVVLPEMTTTIKLSSSDLNRIICPTEIKDALTSDEKGLMITIAGKDVFVKYKVLKRDGKLSYSSTPTELFVVCGGSTYSMIAYPGRMPSQTIKLSSGKEDRLKENQALYAGIPFEKRLIRAIKEVYTESIPESYTVKKRKVVDNTWKKITVTSLREVDVEGEGITVKEYYISLKPGQGKPFKLSEKMFLRKELSLNPVAVSLDKLVLRPGEVSRLFIVEQRADRSSNAGLMLPSLEESSSVVPQPPSPSPGLSSSAVASRPSPGLKQLQRNLKN